LGRWFIRSLVLFEREQLLFHCQQPLLEKRVFSLSKSDETLRFSTHPKEADSQAHPSATKGSGRHGLVDRVIISTSSDHVLAC